MATSKGIVSGAAAKGLAPGYALAKNGGTISPVALNPTPASTVKEYNIVANPQGGFSYNSYGGVVSTKNATTLAEAQAAIQQGNKQGTYKINNPVASSYLTDTNKFTTTDNSQTNGFDINYTKFGKEASLLQAKDPLFLDRRNNFIATDLATKKTTSDQDIKNYLLNNEGYKTASDFDKEKTFNEIKSKITGVKPPTPSKTPDWDKVLDDIAKAQGFESADDLKSKTNQDFTDFGQMYYNAKATGDQNQIDAFNSMLAQNIQKNAALIGFQGQEHGQENAILSFYKDNAPGIFNDKQKIDDLLNKGYNNQQIANNLGKDTNYVNDMINNDISKYVNLTPEKQQELLKFNTMEQQKTEMDKQSQMRDRQLALDQAQQDYQSAYQDQTKNNEIMAKNMSTLARMTGAGYSSLGLEGFDNVYQQGQKALSELTRNFNNYSEAQQNAITDITNGYTYNMKLYNMQADDLIKNAKNGFFNTFQTIKSQYGELSNKTMEEMNTLADNYIKQVQTINQWRTQNMQTQTDSLRQRQMDMLKLQGQYPNMLPTTNSNTNQQSGVAPRLNNTITNLGNATDTGVDYDVKVGDPITAPVAGILTFKTDAKTGNVSANIKQTNGDTVQINHLDPATINQLQALNGKTISAGTQIGRGGNSGNVKDINGNRLRKDGKVLNQAALDAGTGSHIDVRVTSGGQKLYGQDLVDYLNHRGTVEGLNMVEYGLKESDRSLVDKIASGDKDIKSISGMGKDIAQYKIALQNAVLATNPNWSESLAPFKQNWKSKIGSSAYRGNIDSFNTAIKHVVAMTEAYNKLNNRGAGVWNGVTNTFENLVPGDTVRKEAKAQYETERSAAMTEMAKAVKGVGALNEAEQKDWKDNMNIGLNAPPSRFQGSVKGALNLLMERMDTFYNDYQNVVGAPPTDLMDNKAQLLLNSEALDFMRTDIDGFPYLLTNTNGGQSASTPQGDVSEIPQNFKSKYSTKG